MDKSDTSVPEEQQDGAEGTTVLLVDDEQLLRQAYADSLKSEYIVITAENGEAALAAMNDDIDVVVLDRRMPGLGGTDVLERLRDNGYDVPVAVVSAIDPDGEEMDQQADAYLFKPVGREDLLTTIEQLTASL